MHLFSLMSSNIRSIKSIKHLYSPADTVGYKLPVNRALCIQFRPINAMCTSFRLSYSSLNVWWRFNLKQITPAPKYGQKPAAMCESCPAIGRKRHLGRYNSSRMVQDTSQGMQWKRHLKKCGARETSNLCLCLHRRGCVKQKPNLLVFFFIGRTRSKRLLDSIGVARLKAHLK